MLLTNNVRQTDSMWSFVGFLTFAAFVSAEDHPAVQIPNGPLSGLYVPAFDQNLFLGIPYAQPPLGDLHFAHPQPYDGPLPRLRDATSYGPSCYGIGPFSDGMVFDEDCLTLNIITPAGGYEESLPVFVWVHRGKLTQYMKYMKYTIYN